MVKQVVFDKKIWYSELFLQLRKWCNLSNGLDGFKAGLIACPSHTNNGMHSDHWFPAPLLKLFSDTLKTRPVQVLNFTKWRDRQTQPLPLKKKLKSLKQILNIIS